jgi:hypothetical protein
LAYWPNWPVGPTEPTAHPAHLAGLNQLARVWSTDPARAPPLVYSPLTPELAGDPDRPRRRPANPADSGNLCRRRLYRMLASTSSTDTSSWNSRVLPPSRRSGWFSSRDPPPPIASGPVLLPASSPLLAAHPLVLEMCCTRRWKTSLDRIQPAARALLRHAVWTSVWAQGEFLLPLLPHPLLLSLAMVSDHLVKTHEPSSPSCLSDTADDSG